MAPVSDLGVKLYTFAPSEKFMAHLHLAVWTGIAASAPFFLLQAGVFIWPALKRKERRYALAALLVVPALFITGAGMAYKLLSPVVLRFFLSFGASDGVQPLWGLNEYLGLLSSVMLAAGLLLQAPLLLLISFALGIIAPRTVAGFRPHIILLIFFLAGVCTPPDVVSQAALGIPLYLLFELTLLIGRFIAPGGRSS
jgi:sec-independent protein translocase protein TatC